MPNVKYDLVSTKLRFKSSDEWPDSFEAENISRMQCPNDISASQAICKTIVAECKVSHLKHTVSVEIRHRPAPAAADSSDTASLMRAAMIDTSFEATIYRITAPDLENWMLKQRVVPSEYLSWWFESASTVHDDTAMMATVSNGTPAVEAEVSLVEPKKAEPVKDAIETASDGPVLLTTAPAWSLITSLARAPGYRWPLYQFLKDAHIAVKPCPKAQDVLDAWKLNPPYGLRVVQSGRSDELEYELTHGGKKTADRRAIQTAISGLVV